MIILYLIAVLLLITLAVAFITRNTYGTFLSSFKNAAYAMLGIVSFFGFCIGISYLIVHIFTLMFGGKEYYHTPTTLVCNKTVIAESVDGFSYNERSGTYIDYRNNITYTPKQGEVCIQVLKGGE